LNYLDWLSSRIDLTWRQNGWGIKGTIKLRKYALVVEMSFSDVIGLDSLTIVLLIIPIAIFDQLGDSFIGCVLSKFG